MLCPIEKELINVVSDGTPFGTHVYLKSGLELSNIKSIRFNLDSYDCLATVTLEFGLIDVNLKGQFKDGSNPIPQPAPFGGHRKHIDSVWSKFITWIIGVFK